MLQVLAGGMQIIQARTLCFAYCEEHNVLGVTDQLLQHQTTNASNASQILPIPHSQAVEVKAQYKEYGCFGSTVYNM